MLDLFQIVEFFDTEKTERLNTAFPKMGKIK